MSEMFNANRFTGEAALATENPGVIGPSGEAPWSVLTVSPGELRSVSRGGLHTWPPRRWLEDPGVRSFLIYVQQGGESVFLPVFPGRCVDHHTTWHHMPSS